MAEDPLREFLEVMRRLRRDCAWKADQTHRSLVRYLLEETHETVEAIETGDAEHLREELGDLLLQVYFHAVLAEESGEFTLDDVAADVTEKMRRRNPHVFGTVDGSRLSPTEVDDLWQSVKATEQTRSRPTDGLPASLPALLYADKVLERLARAGVAESGAESDAGLVVESVAVPGAGPGGADGSPPIGADAIGEGLLALVARARGEGVDPEQALRDAVRRLLAGR